VRMRISECSPANSAATSMRHFVTSFVAPRSPLNFSALSHNRCNFRKKVIESLKACFDFIYNFCLKHFSF
jgi:hypothetical protein